MLLTGAGVVGAVGAILLGLVTLIGSWLPANGNVVVACCLPAG